MRIHRRVSKRKLRVGNLQRLVGIGLNRNSQLQVRLDGDRQTWIELSRKSVGRGRLCLEVAADSEHAVQHILICICEFERYPLIKHTFNLGERKSVGKSTHAHLVFHLRANTIARKTPGTLQHFADQGRFEDGLIVVLIWLKRIPTLYHYAKTNRCWLIQSDEFQRVMIERAQSRR